MNKIEKEKDFLNLPTPEHCYLKFNVSLISFYMEFCSFLFCSYYTEYTVFFWFFICHSNRHFTMFLKTMILNGSVIFYVVEASLLTFFLFFSILNGYLYMPYFLIFKIISVGWFLE